MIMNEKRMKALNYMIGARDAVIREMAASAGKARLHAPTFVAICQSIVELRKCVDEVSPSIQTAATKEPAESPKKRTKD